MRVLCAVVAAAVFALVSGADPEADGCEEQTKMLNATELKEVFGYWTLIEGFADHSSGDEVLKDASSSHIDLHHGEDNSTIYYNEWNMDSNKNCTAYYSKVEEDSQDGELTLKIVSDLKEEKGVVTAYNDSGVIQFYQTCDGCLTMMYNGIFNGTKGRYLLFYRKKGQQFEEDALKAAQEANKKQVDCLKFDVVGHFTYDGKAEFCAMPFEDEANSVKPEPVEPAAEG